MLERLKHRQALRRSIALPVQCRVLHGLREGAWLSDISTHGCGIALRSMRPVVGARMMIKPATIEALSGVVRWVREDRCGVEFDTPLYPPVVDHLCRAFAEKVREESVDLVRTRGLGDRL